MLRVANFHESRFRNDGNPLYVTACLKRMQYYGGILAGIGANKELHDRWWPFDAKDEYAEKAAKDLLEKHNDVVEVDHFYPTGDLVPFGTYDLNLHIDWGEDALANFLPYKPIDTPHPLAYWASDTHINNGLDGDSYPHRLAMAKKADFVFCAQKRAVGEFRRDGIANPIWLPHAAEPMAWPKTDMASKRYDVCFVGHVNNKLREDALDRLFSEFPNFYYGQAQFENAARKFCESKIVFNIAMTTDINMRVPEALSTGSFLLTNRIEYIEELYEDKKHLVLYDGFDDMIEKARYYLSHDKEREAIAEAGHKHFLANHTIQHRVNVILETFLSTRKKIVLPEVVYA